jgi:hypothetical protein
MNIIEEINQTQKFIEQEWKKEFPNFQKISFYENMIRSLKETYLEEMIS